MKNNYLVQAWLVLVLAICFGAALAGVQVSLGPKIEENKRLKTLSRIPQIVPGADQQKTEEVEIDGQIAYQAFSSDGEHVGWVVKASGQGYADVIELLVGLSPDAERLTGMTVLAQKETPALGDKITTAGFQDQFREQPADGSLAVDKDGGQVVAITAATISSRSVCDIVNDAVEQWKPKLSKR